MVSGIDYTSTSAVFITNYGCFMYSINSYNIFEISYLQNGRCSKTVDSGYEKENKQEEIC